MTADEKNALLTELASLPNGTIVRRVIRGAERFYHQWREDGKTKSRYLKADEHDALRQQLDRRSELTRRLRNKGTVPTKDLQQAIQILGDVFTPLGVKLQITGDEVQNSRFTILRLCHLLETTDFGSAFATPETARTFLATHVGSGAYDTLKELARAWLLEEPAGTVPMTSSGTVPNNLPFVRLFEEAGWILPTTLETIGKSKKIDKIHLFYSSFIRRCLGTAVIRELLESEALAHHGAAERKAVRENLLQKLEERILEEEIILQFRRKDASAPSVDSPLHVNGDRPLHLIRFASGGRGIVVADENELTCELYTVRNAEKREEQMLIDLADPGKLDALEHRYGLITARIVLYLGRNAQHPTGVEFRSVKDLRAQHL